MSEDIKNETENVQQTDGLTGQVNNQAKNEDGCIVDANEQRQQALEKRKAELQQRRQEANAEKQKERLDYALLCIRDHGGSISRKQLTEILMKKFDLKRTTISRFLAAQIEAKALYEVNKMIYASDDLALAF